MQTSLNVWAPQCPGCEIHQASPFWEKPLAPGLHAHFQRSLSAYPHSIYREHRQSPDQSLHSVPSLYTQMSKLPIRKYEVRKKEPRGGSCKKRKGLLYSKPI